jgi:uncharacterized protein (DUF433 family)
LNTKVLISINAFYISSAYNIINTSVACKLMTALYFKRHWDEATGDELTDSWGLSTYYFETDEKLNVTRQIQLFDNGNTLKYDTEYVDDKFGGLSEIQLDINEFADYRIDKNEFEQLWETSHYKKFPEIVCTHDTLWGQPRLDGRRLAVGDIVSLVDTYHEDINIVLTDFELSLQQVRQALHYCKDLKCKKDNPEKFCYNCLLRVEQFNKTIDKDEPEQANWLRADKLFKQHFKPAS